MRTSRHRFRAPSFIPPPVPARNATKISSRYENVRASIDSGLNMRKINERFPEARVNARFKKEEFFRRITPPTLMRLLNEKEVDCLILDVRDRESFQSCHMKDAISFPAPLLKRSVNVFSIQILNFVNKEPRKIIVIYDENGHSAMNTGNLFVEKGVDNIFLLNGGLREMAGQYPEMVEGSLTVQGQIRSGTPAFSVNSEPCASPNFSPKSRWRPTSVGLVGKRQIKA